MTGGQEEARQGPGSDGQGVIRVWGRRPAQVSWTESARVGLTARGLFRYLVSPCVPLSSITTMRIIIGPSTGPLAMRMPG